MKTIRDKLQENIAQAFIALDKLNALAIIPTGTGKLRIVLLILEELRPEKVLYLTHSLLDRNVTIPDEFKKWDMEYMLERTEIVTYQSAYKWNKKEKSLKGYFIIADEVDFIGPEYSKFFKTYKNIDTFAMTGFADKEKLTVLKKFFPVIVNITREQLQEEGILNKARIVFVQYCLNTNKSILVKYTKGGIEREFTTSENNSYAYFSKWKDKVLGQMNEQFHLKNFEEYDKLNSIIAETIPRRRASFMWNLDSTIRVVKQLKIDILKHEKNKVISFFRRTKSADASSKFTYHGKNTSGINTKNFNDFNSAKIRELSVVGKINRGVNMVGLNNIILAQYSSSITEITQIVGRGLRLNSNEIMTLYILLPYYVASEDDENVIKPTVAVKWAKAATKIFDLKNIDTEIINLCPGEIKK